jgi:hypothetical protein
MISLPGLVFVSLLVFRCGPVAAVRSILNFSVAAKHTRHKTLTNKWKARKDERQTRYVPASLRTGICLRDVLNYIVLTCIWDIFG